MEFDYNKFVDHLMQSLVNVAVVAIPAIASVVVLWLKAREAANAAKESTTVTRQGNQDISDIGTDIDKLTLTAQQNSKVIQEVKETAKQVKHDTEEVKRAVSKGSNPNIST